jgi:dihydrofolate synthase/folylpolyglutamate synthase
MWRRFSSSGEYEAMVKRLMAKTQRIDRLGVHSTAAMMRHMGLSALSYPVVHVGGTNGKGSVCFKVAHGLEQAGLRVGLFSSPHIYSYRERVSINGETISEDDVLKGLTTILSTSEDEQEFVSFFEATTLLALEYFERKAVDVAVIEVGLGGAMDSTNVVSPVASVLTSISKDHTSILGDSVESIMREKMGIIKPRVPIVIGPTVPEDMVRACAEHTGSEVFVVQPSAPRLTQSYDDENTDIAVATLNVLDVCALPGWQLKPQVPDAWRDIVRDVRPNCRFQETLHGSGVRVIMDVAHNEAGVARMLAMLRERYPLRPVRVVMGMSSGKAVAECIAPLLADQLVRCISLVQSGSVDHKDRVVASTDLLRSIEGEVSSDTSTDKVRIIAGGRVGDAIDTVMRESLEYDDKRSMEEREDIVLACGSFYIMPEIVEALAPRTATQD